MKNIIFLLLFFPLFYRGQTIKSNPNLGIMFAKTPLISADLKNNTNYFFNGLENYNLIDYKGAIEINPSITMAYYKGVISKE